jgi:sterol desaturase/sphingolipid hydroxylase (fatty acid hydroxylase superfamily)
MNGPSQHQMHHGRGRKNVNYSLVFTFFDRLFGTYAAPEPAPLEAGEREPTRT